MKLSLNDLEMAVEFVSGDPAVGAEAFLDKELGRIYYLGDGVDEEVPEDLHDSERYIEVPSKQDLDLGRSMVLRFVGSEIPEEYDQVYAYFSKRGAFSKFKSRLEQIGKLEQWYTFQEKVFKETLEQWCIENSIGYAS